MGCPPPPRLRRTQWGEEWRLKLVFILLLIKIFQHCWESREFSARRNKKRRIKVDKIIIVDPQGVAKVITKEEHLKMLPHTWKDKNGIHIIRKRKAVHQKRGRV